MSKEYDPRRDEGDEFQQRRARPGRRPPPTGRRFTPARNTGGAQGRRPQQPQQSGASTPPGQRPTNPLPNRRRESQVDDSEYEQFLRYRHLQRSRQNQQQAPARRPARDPRSGDEEYEQFRRYQQYRRSSQQQGRSAQRPAYIHDDEYDTYQRVPPRRSSGTIGPGDRDYQDYGDDDDDTALERPAQRSPSRPLTPTTMPLRQPRPRRRVGSTLLIGCLGGIVSIAIIAGIILFVIFRVLPGAVPGLNIGASAYTSPQQTVPLPITQNTTQLQIQNPAGKISITIDPNATTGTLIFDKKTMATSQSNANTEFARITVTANTGNSTSCPATTCLIVTAAIANLSNDAVDMMVTLPPKIVMLSSTSQNGNVSVQGFDGLLSLTNDTGNLSVKGGLLTAGSCLQTRAGNVTFVGTLETANPPAINPCTSAPVSSSGASSDQPWYSMKTGTGNVDVTINTVSSTILLDASINNQGKIISDFPLTIKQNSDGTSNYFGPLLPNTQPSALLILTVDVSGNITLHKAG